MIFNTEIPSEALKAMERLEWTIDRGKTVEITVKEPIRSLSQNRYQHLLFAWFGLHFGYTPEEVKQEIYKKVVNPDLFYEGSVDGPVNLERWRSTADLDVAETSLAIDRFRDFSALHGHYLPEPSDLVALAEIEREMSKNSNKQYLEI